MTHQQKQQVREALIRYAAHFDTTALAAENLQDVNEAAISLIMNNSLEMVPAQTWLTLARQVGFYCGDWQPADTCAHLLLRILCNNAVNHAAIHAVAMAHGLGKTFTAHHFVQGRSNVLYVAGNTAYNRQGFLQALLQAAGTPVIGPAPLLLQHLVKTMTEMHQPMVIVDDAHLLRDGVLHVLADLMQRTAGTAGFVVMGDDTLRLRVAEGVRCVKPGFADLHGLLGKFVVLHSTGPNDVALVCHANGLYDEDAIAWIRNACHNNLHNAACLITQHMQQGIAA